ncbi:MAG: ABC transporter substrate-binding protein [Oscillospiraceae bacterium]|jgi:iron complex transport system substrate-binding protein|nr:ABC transporter substrate-binding protein [Oscillospiraceae bacterium]
MKKLLAVLLALTLVFALVACAKEGASSPSEPPAATTNAPASTEAPAVSEVPETPAEPSIAADRQGNPITIPAEINRVITFGPANAEILVGLGVADKIIAIDTYAFDVAGLPADLPAYDMYTPDAEQILTLEPDVLIVTGMAQSQGSDPFKPLSDAGVCVIYVPSSESIEGIREDIRFLGNVFGKTDAANTLVADIDAKIAEVKAIGDTITDKKTVFFTLADSSYLYSFGSGTFLNEIIELVGAANVFADQTSWIGVSDEQVLSANPDVILTSVNYLEDAIADIVSIPGFDAITAVQNGDVYYIDTNLSNRANQNITKAIDQIAEAIYPDVYK